MRTDYFDVKNGRVILGRAEELSDPDHQELAARLKELRPWKKGPFQIFGHDVDASWKSDLKWDRVKKFIDPIAGRRICDVGCNNGYFLYRAAQEKPEFLLGLDPAQNCHDTYRFLNSIYALPNTEFLVEGYRYLEKRKNEFDILLCMGVVYHHPNPAEILAILRQSLKAGGQLVLESMALPDDYSADPVSLSPRGRYGGAKGIHFVPNKKALESWLHRAGYSAIKTELIHAGFDEQLRTEWADIECFSEFVKDDKTSEGYPAPVRIYISARK